MRLRQSHALITTAAALETAGIGIEMHPFDIDEYTAPHITCDHMTGSVEYSDPTRIYNIDIYPELDDNEIGVYVTFGLGPDRLPLFQQAFEVQAKREDSDTYDDISPGIVAQVIAAIRDHEKPYEAAYAARAGQAPREQQ